MKINSIFKQELLEEVFPAYRLAQKSIAIACSTYNHLRPHGSIDNLKSVEAHQKSGELKKRWKNYWQPKQGKEDSMA